MQRASAALKEVVVQEAISHDGAPQLRVPTMTDRPPHGVAGAVQMNFEPLLDLVPGLRVRAAKLAHHFRIAAVGPPVQRVFNGIHRGEKSCVQHYQILNQNASGDRRGLEAAGRPIPSLRSVSVARTNFLPSIWSQRITRQGSSVRRIGVEGGTRRLAKGPDAGRMRGPAAGSVDERSGADRRRRAE